MLPCPCCQVGDELDLAYGAQIAISSGARVVVCLGAVIGAEAGALLTAVAQVRTERTSLNGDASLSSGDALFSRCTPLTPLQMPLCAPCLSSPAHATL